MNVDEIQVRDLFECAYLLLCQGLSLADMSVQGTNGRKVVIFTVAGEGAAARAADYRAGRAMANVGLLKFTIDKLKDQMFDAIREREREERAHVIHLREHQR